jgi:HK97 family phage prohead protease
MPTDIAARVKDFDTKQTKQVALHQVKAVDSTNGGFMGYASVFNQKDSYGEATVPGCFKTWLQEFINDGWIAEGHKWGEMGFGYIKNAYEDGYGLMIEVEFHSDANSQAIRTKINERIAAGKSVKLSIGYYLKAWKWLEEESTLLLTEVQLKEVSVVNVPALQSASVMSAKSFEEMSFEQHAAHAAMAVKAFAERVEARVEARTGDRKAGAELSAQNVAQIDSLGEAIGNLNQAFEPVKALADRNRKGLESGSSNNPLESGGAKDDLPSTEELFKKFADHHIKYHQLQQEALS